ncbi:MAG: ferritin-like domain-containing protein [Caulobacteraceae bacterium]|nr:ferritin-like domain-containing protein [Caulobacter sp.]
MNDAAIIEALERRALRRQERRDFFRSAGALAAGAAAAATLGGEMGLATSAQAQTSAPTDADVFNFALNLEYLEANFYNFAVNGVPISSSNPALVSGVGTPGQATGGRQVAFSDPVVQAYARQLVHDELGHITFIRSQLGAAAIAQPAIDLGASPTSAFSLAAQSAGAVGAGQSFDPYANDINFLLATFLFVEVGTSAYLGGAGLITNKTYLEAAAGILAVEAYHSGIARSLLYSKGQAMPSAITNANGISDARDSLDGPTDDDLPLTQNGQPILVNADPSTSIAFPRTAGATLNIAFLTKAAATKGGFFPNGVNGTLNTSTAEP